MSNQWLRLWHDMPTDPKWRTIARISGQRIGDVIAVYTHMLVCASNATERGRTQSFCSEDVASALDIGTEQVDAILSAMQGRVWDGDKLLGWEKRQVAREDGSAERSKAWREARKAEKQASLNDAERDRTHAERKQTPDKDTDTDKSNTEGKPSVARATRKCPDSFIVTAELAQWAATECPLVDFDLETKKLRDYTYKTARSNWDGTWRNWMRTAQQAADTRRTIRPPTQTNKQEALEQRNKGVAEKWARGE